MTTYKVTVNENGQDCGMLDQTRQNRLAMSIGVEINGSMNHNLIYQIGHLSSQVELAWQDSYSLCFTTNRPRPGTSITMMGRWQSCQLGKGYELDEQGMWSPLEGGRKEELNVSSRFREEVFIVIGVKDPNSGRETAIFVSNSPLRRDERSSYKPTQEVKLWWSGNVMSGSIIHDMDERQVKKAQISPSDDRNKFHYDASNQRWD